MLGEETLTGLLDRVRLTEGGGPDLKSPYDRARPLVLDPGLWAVSWAQGAVAAGATQVHFDFRGRAAEFRVSGPVSANAQELVEAYLARESLPGAERYWVSALREAPTPRFTVMTRHGAYRQVARVVDGRLDLSIGEFRGDMAPLVLTMESPKGRSLLNTWGPETQALTSRLRYCPTPILLGGKLISGHTAYKQTGALMCWLEQAGGDEPSFAVRGDPRQILAPHLIKTQDSSPSLLRCSLMVTLCRVAHGSGLARVWWMRDGALLGPVRIIGPTGVLSIEIVCPGDRPGYDFMEWALRHPASFFPSKQVLGVARRLAGGLESLLPQLAYRSGPVDDLLRKANEMARFPQIVPLRGRPHIALGGSFYDSLKAFSLRANLELAP